MRLMPFTSVRSLLLAAAAACLLAIPAGAQAPPLKLALEVNARDSIRGERDAAQSMARQVATHLIPQFEARGWKVVRVFSARKAARKERCHAAIRVDIDAERVYHLHDARVYEDEHGRDLVADFSKSANAWGDWVLWDGMAREVVTDGVIIPVTPRLHTAGAGRPELDDEASIARLVADAVGTTLLDALAYTRAMQP